MDPKGKGMVVNDKEKESFVNDPKEDKPTDSGSSHKRRDGKIMCEQVSLDPNRYHSRRSSKNTKVDTTPKK
jgi:hypothetical protein